ncbi:Rieske (2Fe-2S) protein [Hydrogenophaga soli]|nr:Rieske 2Fe-2S domain-containing protein [Burkholderiaceae bacterium]
MVDEVGACPLTGDVWHPLCNLQSLQERGSAVAFDVMYAGQTCRAFAILYNDKPHAYLNRCTHVPMELDWQPNQVFDISGRWLLCATHGAHYRPDTGACAGGPCRGGLVKIPLDVRDGVVWWRADRLLQPVLNPP